MSKLSLYIIIIALVACFGMFGYTFNKLLHEIETSAISTLETYCGPESAEHYKLRSNCE
jgi:hypothetical protein